MSDSSSNSNRDVSPDTSSAESSEMGFTLREQEAVLCQEINELVKHTKRESGDVSLGELNNIQKLCEIVEQNILHETAEEPLTVMVQKLDVGSNIALSIRNLQFCYSDMQLAQTIDSALMVRKFKKIAEKIHKKHQLDVRREKYFFALAKSKIIERLSQVYDNDGSEQQVAEATVEDDKMVSNLLDDAQPILVDFTPRLEFSDMQLQQPSLLNQPPTDQLLLDLPELDPRPSFPLLPTTDDGPSMLPEEPVRMPSYIETIEETASRRSKGDVADLTDARGTPDDLQLPALPDGFEAPKRKKKDRPMLDDSIRIEGYTSRAIRLHTRVTTGRVMVYEGPSSLIEAMSRRFLMTHPGRLRTKPSPPRFRPLRCIAGCLGLMYKRHLVTEGKEEEREAVEMTQVEESRAVGELPPDVMEVEVPQAEDARADCELPPDVMELVNILEGDGDVGVREEGRVEGAEWGALPEAAPDTPAKAQEDLVGIPVYKLSGSLSKAGSASPPRTVPEQPGPASPGVPEEPVVAPQAHRIPSSKWKWTRLVEERLAALWGENGDGELTIVDILQEDFNKENSLELFKTLNKISLTRTILLDYVGGTLFIKPFKPPHVTEKQYRLRGQLPKF